MNEWEECEQYMALSRKSLSAIVAGQKLLESRTRGFRALETVTFALVAINLRSVSDDNLTFGTRTAYDH